MGQFVSYFLFNRELLKSLFPHSSRHELVLHFQNSHCKYIRQVNWHWLKGHLELHHKHANSKLFWNRLDLALFNFSLDAALEDLLGFGNQPVIFWSLWIWLRSLLSLGFVCLLANARDEEPFIWRNNLLKRIWAEQSWATEKHS